MLIIKVCTEGRTYTQDITFKAETYEDAKAITEVLWRYGDNVSKIEITETKEEQDDEA